MLKATIPLALRNHISFISFIILVKHLSDLNTQIKMPGVECKEYKASCRVLPIEYQHWNTSNRIPTIETVIIVVCLA